MKVRPLCKALQIKAESELNEVPNRIEEDIQHLKNWLAKQPHLKARNDDQLLLNFLRGSKFSLERVKKKIDAYYTLRTLDPEMAQNMDPFHQHIQTLLGFGCCVPLPIPKNDETSPRVLLIRYEDYNADEITLTVLLKNVLIVLDILLNDDDNYVISGLKIVWDMKNIQFRTALQATPSMIKKIIYSYETALPTRFKALHIINIPMFFEQMLNKCKMLVSKKLAKRMHFYSANNMEALYADIPKSILPNEYGGEIDNWNEIKAEWKKTVESQCDRLLNEKNYFSDESKRSTKDSMYECEGSFKKLQVDDGWFVL